MQRKFSSNSIANGRCPRAEREIWGSKGVLKPASEGTGVMQEALYVVLEVGVHNVLSKSQGSSNPHNVVKATFDALLQLRSPQTIAKQRGISWKKFLMDKKLDHG